ncbi:DUF3108 domain-containing protein [Xanthobacter sp. V3C-3]|uniref:DUF3108 domain-containing protein n=1 Tax=Xanthobacter lutulentifluminis TaxID=3119935 RepID=UPI0037271441
MIKPRLAFLSAGPARLLCAGALVAGLGAPALADGKLNAKYSLTVGGVELGRGSIAVAAGDASYEISGTARVTGVLRAVSSGKGVAASRGAFASGKMVPRLYAMNAEADGKEESARIAMASGAVKEMDVEPALKPAPDRVPVTDDVLQNIIDPMSGAFVYVPGTADLLSSAACERSIPVFDGRQRYDISLSYLRTEAVKAEGYAGKAVVCAVRYAPIAGHRPSRYTVKYLMESRDMFVWLVPIAGTRLLAPFKVSVATLIGTAVLQASAFETQATGGPVPVSAPRP